MDSAATAIDRRTHPLNDPTRIGLPTAAATIPASGSNLPTFRLASSDEDRAAVYRLRYDLYVEDQGLFLDQADHSRRWLTDAYDPHSCIVMAEFGGELVGTIRMTFGHDLQFSPDSREEYDFDRFAGVVDDVDQSIITRLVVRKDLRGGSLGRDLLHKAFELAAVRGAELILGSCEIHLVNYYLKLGFRTFGALDNHPTNGVLVRIAAVMGDLEHFERIESPMTSAVALRTRPCPHLATLRSRVEGDAAVVSEFSLGPEDFRRALTHRSAATAPEPTFLDTLNPDELARLVCCSHLLDCAPGDQLVLEGHQTRVPYILLSGGLEIRDADDRRYRLDRPGALVGEVALFAASRRPSDLVAGAQGARVLAFDDRTLRTLLAEHGPLASKFYAFATRELSRKLIERGTPESPGESEASRPDSPQHPVSICRSLPHRSSLRSRGSSQERAFGIDDPGHLQGSQLCHR